MRVGSRGLMQRSLMATALFGSICGALLLVPTTNASAETPGRYVMQQTPEGMLRLDTQTGAVSLCKSAAGTWACTPVADDARGVDEELKRLRAENAELKEDVKRLEEIAGLGPGAPDKPATKDPGIKLPDEKDVEKAMSYVQRMLKIFRDKLRELEEEMSRPSEPKKGTTL